MLIMFLHIIFAGEVAEQCALTGATARIKFFGSYLMALYAWRCHILPKLHPLQTKRFLKNNCFYISSVEKKVFLSCSKRLVLMFPFQFQETHRDCKDLKMKVVVEKL